MKKRNRPVGRAWVFLPVALFTLVSVVAAEPGTKGVKVLVTNDVHGYVFEDKSAERIGYALLRGYADALEREGYVVYLMDAGDAFSGSATAQFDSGRSIAETMGRMGYRVLTPGNHAFDFNASENDSLYYPNVLLKRVADSAEGPVDAVCLNLSYEGRPLPAIRDTPLVLHDADGVRITVCGLVTPYVAAFSNREWVNKYDFGLVSSEGVPDHAATREKLLGLLTRATRGLDRPEDVVIVLSHLGWDEGAEYANGEISGKDLAAAPNVDAVVDAHSHTYHPVEKIGGALYGNSGRYLKNFAEITITGEGGNAAVAMEIKGYAALAAYAPAERILTALRALSDRLGLGDRLFYLDDDGIFSDRNIHTDSTPLGRFVCRTLARITDADLALYNSGGIRSGIGGGWATVGSVYDTLPFQNNLLAVAMTGKQIEEMARSFPARGSNGFPQLYGMTIVAWEGEGRRLGIAGLFDRDGMPLEAGKTYTVAMSSFMARGGDGYSFPDLEVRKDYGDCAAAIVNHLRTDGDMTAKTDAPHASLVLCGSREEAERVAAAMRECTAGVY